MKRISKKHILAIISALTVMFLPVRFAHAIGVETLIGVTAGMVAKVIMSITVPIGWVGSLIFRLAGLLIEWALTMNGQILNLQKNFFLEMGWKTVINIADLALIVAMIVIAFATMLDYQSYGMKKALPKLIVVALLVNFSLAIPGVLMDITGLLTAFFVNQSGLAGGGMSSALASAFDISKMFEVKPEMAGQVKTISAAGALSTAVLIPIGSIIFQILFTIIASIILFTFAWMLVVRYIKLSFLLIVSPLIFVAWIFPATKKQWTKWWDDFIRWTLFAPIVMFFVWLSVAALRKSAADVSSVDAAPAMQSLNSALTFQAGSLVNMVMAAGLLMGSLIAANSMSISGAKGAKVMADGVARRTKEFAARESARQARKLKAVTEEKLKVKEGLAFAKRQAVRVPVVGGMAARGIMGAEKASKKQTEALYKAAEDKYKNYSNDDLKLLLPRLDSVEQSYVIKRLAEKGDVGSMPPAMLDKMIGDKKTKEAFERYGKGDQYEELEKGAMRNTNMITAQRAIGAATTPAQVASAQAAFNLVEKQFMDKVKRENFDNIKPAQLLDPVYGNTLTQAMLRRNPESIGKILARTKDDAELTSIQGKMELMSDAVRMNVDAAFNPAESAAVEAETHAQLDKILLSVGAAAPAGATIVDKMNLIETTKLSEYKKINNGQNFTPGELTAQLEFIKRSNAARYNALKGVRTDPQYDKYVDHERVIRMQRAMTRNLGGVV